MFIDVMACPTHPWGLDRRRPVILESSGRTPLYLSFVSLAPCGRESRKHDALFAALMQTFKKFEKRNHGSRGAPGGDGRAYPNISASSTAAVAAHCIWSGGWCCVLPSPMSGLQHGMLEQVQPSFPFRKVLWFVAPEPGTAQNASNRRSPQSGPTKSHSLCRSLVQTFSKVLVVLRGTGTDKRYEQLEATPCLAQYNMHMTVTPHA